jgi:RNA polymerase sigma-70 factor, ECF subfamily
LYHQLDPSDEALASRIAQQDVTAFSMLYDRYARAIYVLAAHTIGAAEAEEIVQDVFLRLWDKAHQFDSARGSFAAWFMTIARNHVMDALSKRSQHQRLVAAEAIDYLLMKTADPMINIEEEAGQRQQLSSIFQALKTLPEEQRRVLILAYFGGLSQSTIAERLNWPLGTVKKRIRLGLQKLRTYLSGHDTPVKTEPEVGTGRENL